MELRRATPVRELGAMQAEPPTRLQADVGVDVAIRELEAARPTLEGVDGWADLARAPELYRDLLNAWSHDVQMAKTDPDLTLEAKWRNVRRISGAWRSDAESTIDDLERGAARLERVYGEAARPPAPATSDLQGVLANARSDVLLALANATDDDAVDRLGALARSGDAAVTYLLLATNFVPHLFRGKGWQTAPHSWPLEAGQALAELLSGDALAAHRMLPAVERVRHAARALRGGHELAVLSNTDLFGDDG